MTLSWKSQVLFKVKGQQKNQIFIAIAMCFTWFQNLFSFHKSSQGGACCLPFLMSSLQINFRPFHFRWRVQQTVSWESVTWPSDYLCINDRPLLCTVGLISSITIVPHEKTKVSETGLVLMVSWDRTACVQWNGENIRQPTFPVPYLKGGWHNKWRIISLTTWPQIRFLWSFALSNSWPATF